jgi:hypothetical protein
VSLLIAVTGLYYAFFFVLLLLAIVGSLGGIRARSFRPVLSAALLITVVISVLAVTNVPSLLYRIDHGTNSEVASRSVTDADNYGLKIANLVLPVTDHRVGPLATLKADTLGGPVPSEGTEALGFIGAAGFVGLLAVAFVRLSTHWRRDADPDRTGDIVGQLAALTITCLVFAVIGGGATVVGVLAFSGIRAWNRISVYIAFFSLTAVGIWLTTLLGRHCAGRRLRLGSAAVVALPVLVAAYDQTTPAFTPAYAATAGQYGSDRAFVAETEHVLGRSASIFQLPYVPFPENPPVVGMTDYDHLRGYIHSDSLRWSYAGVRGRETEWQPTLLAQPIDIATIGMAAVGFDGLYIDRAGYSDHAAQLDSQLRPILGAPLFESEDKRLTMYDLRPLQRRIDTESGPAQLRRAREATLHPPSAQFGAGFYGEERDASTTWHWGTSRAELELANPTSRAQTVSVSFRVDSLDPGSRVTVDGLGRRISLLIGGGAAGVDREVTLGPGITRVQLESNAASPAPNVSDPRDLRFRVLEMKLTAPAVIEVAHGLLATAG